MMFFIKMGKNNVLKLVWNDRRFLVVNSIMSVKKVVFIIIFDLKYVIKL